MNKLFTVLLFSVTLWTGSAYAAQFSPASQNLEECLAIDPAHYFHMTLIFGFDSKEMSKQDVLTVLNKLEEYDVPFKYRYMAQNNERFKIESRANPQIPTQTLDQKLALKNYIREYVRDILDLPALDSFSCEYSIEPPRGGIWWSRL